MPVAQSRRAVRPLPRSTAARWSPISFGSSPREAVPPSPSSPSRPQPLGASFRQLPRGPADLLGGTPVLCTSHAPQTHQHLTWPFESRTQLWRWPATSSAAQRLVIQLSINQSVQSIDQSMHGAHNNNNIGDAPSTQRLVPPKSNVGSALPISPGSSW